MLAASGTAKDEKPEPYSAELVKRAEAGNADAQFRLGCCYYDGIGVARDGTKGMKWFAKSAEQGNSHAQYNLGVCYVKESEVAKDEKEAVKWFIKSAEQGDAMAQSALGTCYANGTGVNQDDKEGFKWYAKSADQGNPKGQYGLGCCYYNGNGVAEDVKEAIKWFVRSAEQGDPSAAEAVALQYHSGLGTVKNPQMALIWAYIATAEGKTGISLVKLINQLEKEYGPKLSAQLRDEARKQLAFIQGGAECKDRETLKGPDNTVSAKFSGTGFVISEDGVVVTAAHLISGRVRVEVVVRDKRFQAKVIRLDSQNDLALLKVAGTGITPLPINDSAKVKVGQPVFTVGFPNIELQGSNPKMTKGDISSNTGFLDAPTCWQISIPVQTGNSGGPLLDEGGNVVGVIVSKLSFGKDGNGNPVPIQNVNYAVKSAYLLPMLAELDVKLPSAKNRWFFKGFESVVQDVEKSVVMILVY